MNNGQHNQRQFVLEKWNEYRRMVIPIGTHPTQVDACRHAFYGGVLGLFAAVAQHIGDQEFSIVESVEKEMSKYVDDVKAGRA